MFPFLKINQNKYPTFQTRKQNIPNPQILIPFNLATVLLTLVGKLYKESLRIRLLTIQIIKIIIITNQCSEQIAVLFFFNITKNLELDFYWYWSLLPLKIILLFCHRQHDGFLSVGFSLMVPSCSSIRYYNWARMEEVRKWAMLFTLQTVPLPTTAVIIVMWEINIFTRRPTAYSPLELIALEG